MPRRDSARPAGARARRRGDLCDPQQQRHTSFYDARGRYTASKRQHRAAALGSLLVRVRTPRARRDVDQGRVLADEGGAGAVSIDVAGGGFPDDLAQHIAKAEARTFTNLNDGSLSFGPWWGRRLRRFNTRSSRTRDPRSLPGKRGRARALFASFATARRLRGPSRTTGTKKGCQFAYAGCLQSPTCLAARSLPLWASVCGQHGRSPSRSGNPRRQPRARRCARRRRSTGRCGTRSHSV